MPFVSTTSYAQIYWFIITLFSQIGIKFIILYPKHLVQRASPPTPSIWASTRGYYIQHSVSIISSFLPLNMKMTRNIKWDYSNVTTWANHYDHPINFLIDWPYTSTISYAYLEIQTKFYANSRLNYTSSKVSCRLWRL
jgi:hypothetical protein